MRARNDDQTVHGGRPVIEHGWVNDGCGSSRRGTSDVGIACEVNRVRPVMANGGWLVKRKDV